MNKKIVLVCMLLLSVGLLSGCIEQNNNNTEIVEDIKYHYSDDNETVIVYIGIDEALDIANIVDELFDAGYIYIGSYTTKRSFSVYSNEAYLIFRLDKTIKS